MIRPLLFILVLGAAMAHGANFPEQYQSALRLYEAGKFSEAKTMFDALSDTHPSPQALDRCLMSASYCENQLKAPDKADALSAKIQDPKLRTFCRAHLLNLRTQYSEVVALLKDEDFDTWPDSLIFDALLCRGNASSRTRDAAGAEKDYRAALGHTLVDYKKAIAHLRLGALHTGQEALDCLEEVMNLKEPGPTMRYQAVAARAKILASDGKEGPALAEFERLSDLTKQPHWTMVQMGRAATCEALGLLDKARACYEAVVASANAPADLLSAAKTKLHAKR